LNGAFVVDGPATRRSDRIFLITLFSDSANPNGTHRISREFWSINGRAWPETERFEYALGDSITWRVINPSADTHPMHLHGFYYRVDAKGANGRDTVYGAGQERMVVTELLRPGMTMKMTWSPDRPGGWIFHCHMTVHLLPPGKLPGQQEPPHDHDPQKHTEQGMYGLIIAMDVRPNGTRPAAPPGTRRQLRLVITPTRNLTTAPGGSRSSAERRATARDSPPPGSRRASSHRADHRHFVNRRRVAEHSLAWDRAEHEDGIVGIASMLKRVRGFIMADSSVTTVPAILAIHVSRTSMTRDSDQRCTPLTVPNPVAAG
jgi:hypothetical protein